MSSLFSKWPQRVWNLNLLFCFRSASFLLQSAEQKFPLYDCNFLFVPGHCSSFPNAAFSQNSLFSKIQVQNYNDCTFRPSTAGMNYEITFVVCGCRQSVCGKLNVSLDVPS